MIFPSGIHKTFLCGRFFLLLMTIGIILKGGASEKRSMKSSFFSDNPPPKINLYYYYTSKGELHEVVTDIPLSEILEETDERVKKGNTPLNGLLIDNKRVFSYILIKNTQTDGSIFFHLYILKDAVLSEYKNLLYLPNETKTLVHGDCWFFAVSGKN